MRTERQQIILDRVRIALNLLRRCDVITSDGREHPILLKLKELQIRVRYSSLENDLEASPVDIISPFLMVIRAKNISGPFKLMCLESLQIFLQTDAFIINGSLDPDAIGKMSSVTSALSELIDATDSAGDELVQLYLLQTLHNVVTNTSLSYLSNDAGASLLDFCFSTLLRTGGVRRAAMLHQEAEHVIVDFFKLLQKRVIEHKDKQETGIDGTCLLKAISYLVNVIRNNSSDSGGFIDSSQPTTTGMNGNNSSITTTTSGEWIHDSELIHLIFTLKTLNHLLSGWGNVNLAREMIMRFPEFHSCIMDQLCGQLLMLCSKRDRFPSIVLQMSLTLFSTIFNSFAICAKVIMECFMKQIYIKALIQSLETLTQMNNNNSSTEEKIQSVGTTTTTTSSGFRLDELEIIMESLCDLLSDSSVIPSLFISFDCDPIKNDIVQPLIHYICFCSQTILTSGSDELGINRELGVLIVQAYKQINRGFVSRQTSSDLYFSSKSVVPSSPLSDLLIASRRTKHILREASELFEKKPELGLKHLQNKQILPIPLTTSSVATFLRVAPGLSKEHVGAFLGELGKDVPKNEWDSKSFHVEVLLKYVQSFALSGQSVLTCLRIFLSAFRLPGEAQQIDRILVAFSEYCHANCIEGRSGQIENPEITYLLTFSIIMLNTDRHNPNIRDDRRMTLEQFIRNNSNYGKDVNQTIPLSRDFLEQIYNSISEFPIRTERNDISATITQEMWMDLQLQSEVDYMKTILIGTEYPLQYLSDLQLQLAMTSSSSNNKEQLLLLPIDITRFLLTSGSGYHLEMNPLQLSCLLRSLHWICDKDLLDCVWSDLMYTSCSVYFNNFQHMNKRVTMNNNNNINITNIDNNNKKKTNRSKERVNRPFQVSHEFLCDLIKLSCYYGLDHILETVIILLIEFTGAVNLQNNMSEKVLYKLESYHDIIHRTKELDVDVDGIRFVNCNEFLYRLSNFPSARLSLSNLLQVIQSNLSHIKKQWIVIWKFLSLLRDCALLPLKMVMDMEKDPLPSNVRKEFENNLLASSDRIRIERNQHLLLKPKKLRNNNSSSSSFLSFQGLGEALFGTSSSNNMSNDDDGDENNPYQCAPLDVDGSSPLSRFNLPSARWDLGYDVIVPKVTTSIDSSSSSSSSSGGTTTTTMSLEEKTSTHTSHVYSIEDIRKQISETNILQIISDTKFIPEIVLINCLTSLVSLVSSAGEEEEIIKIDITNESNDVEVEVDDDSEYGKNPLVLWSKKISSNRSKVDTIISSSSVAWLEIVLVDISLRNRDRFSSIWSLLKNHYSLALKQRTSELTYVTERRVVGLLRISCRMISRGDNCFAADLLELLGELLFIDNVVVIIDENNNPITTTSDLKDSKPSSLLLDLSDQISAGMWSLLTLNVDLLPILPLEQWQTLFRIIAVTSSSRSSFASMKSFEVMAWLLHEPRLVAKVPVFCIIGVKPLLLNQHAPLTVSVGAIHLLTHLHSRLEVLIKEETTTTTEGGNGLDEDYSDTPILWESCWIPILKTLAEGTTDVRETIRSGCVEALCFAILDKHANAVPAGVLVDILGDIVSPLVTLLGSFVSEEACKLLSSSSSSSSSTSTSLLIPSSSSSNESCRHVSITEQCLSALCQVFLLQIQKLAVYPSFDKLWLRILYVLGYFIGSRNNSYGIDNIILDKIEKLNENENETFQILLSLKNTAKEKLAVLLTTLVSEGIFELRDGLWFVTRETVNQMRNGDELMSDLSPPFRSSSSSC